MKSFGAGRCGIVCIWACWQVHRHGWCAGINHPSLQAATRKTDAGAVLGVSEEAEKNRDNCVISIDGGTLAAVLHLDVGRWGRSDLQGRLLGLVLWFCLKSGSLGSVCWEAPGLCQKSWLFAANTGPRGGLLPRGHFGPDFTKNQPRVSIIQSPKEPQLQERRAETHFQE